jgi:predicted ribosome quality control (RQC) complex YloA/Tae2 family protein
MESGVRFHTTKYARDKNDMPSPFAMKLRKFIRTKRLEDIRQIGSDRVVDFKFGSGDSVCHIILELYATGNIVLTDGAYEIQALLRSHQFDDDVAVKMHEIYPIAFTTSLDSLTLNSDNSQPQTILEMSSSQFIEWARQRERLHDEAQLQSQELANTEPQKEGKKSGGGGGGGGGNKKNKVKKMTLRQLLLCKESGIASFGPEIIDHCILSAHLTPSNKVTDLFSSASLSSEQLTTVETLHRELQQGPTLLSLLNTPGQPGYILVRPKKGGAATTEGGDEMGELYDFIPRRYLQHETDHDGCTSIEYNSFDQTVDEYFCKLEEQRMQQQATAAEETAKKKVSKVKVEMENQLKGFVVQQQKMEISATLVELYAEDIDKASLVVNSALAAGVSWDDLEAMVATETAAGNPIASLISKLLLHKNHMILKLPNLNDSSSSSESDESDDEDKPQEEEEEEVKEKEKDSSHKKTKKQQQQQQQQQQKKKQKQKQQPHQSHFIEVEIDLSLSAYANATKLYSNKKVAKVKEEKTAQASEKAIEAVEKQTHQQLEAQRLKRNLQIIRKIHWFEKFNWFITSEGYLILSGRDAQQNEQLVKKYLRSGDAYVHADMHGASSCIVRAKLDLETNKPLPLSLFALQEAGTMTICRSGAWNVKVVMSAWWVHASQVSKTAPTGEYLTTGSFMIYGRKNFLPPTSLEMGFGIMFRLDDSSVSRHLQDRKDKHVEFVDDDSTSTIISEMSERYSIDMLPPPSSASSSSPAAAAAGGGGGGGLLHGRGASESNLKSGGELRKAARANKKIQKNIPTTDVNVITTESEKTVETGLVENEMLEDEGEEIEPPLVEMKELEKEAAAPSLEANSRSKQKKLPPPSKKGNHKGAIPPAAAPPTPTPPPPPQPESGFKKKKAPNKKKARRSNISSSLLLS